MKCVLYYTLKTFDYNSKMNTTSLQVEILINL